MGSLLLVPLIYLKIKYHRSALNSCYLLLFWDCQRLILKNLKMMLYKFSEDVVWFHIIMHLLALIPLDIPPSLLFSWNEECMDYFTLVTSFLLFLFLSLSLIFKIHIYLYMYIIYVYIFNNNMKEYARNQYRLLVADLSSMNRREI